MDASFQAPGDKVKLIKELALVKTSNVSFKTHLAAHPASIPIGTKGVVKKNDHRTIEVELSGQYADLTLTVNTGVWGTYFGPDSGASKTTVLKLKSDLSFKKESKIKVIPRGPRPEMMPKGTEGKLDKTDGKTCRAAFSFKGVKEDKNSYVVTLEMDVQTCLKLFDIN